MATQLRSQPPKKCNNLTGKRTEPIPPFDLIIADEAHRCAGKTGRDFSAVLDGNLIRASKRLFATATPRTYAATVHKAAEERGIEVFGMDDEAVCTRRTIYNGASFR